jgi:purine-binding chemotaxis protein CheW
VCAVPAEHVSETMRPLAIAPLAGVPSFVLGVSVVRGSAVPVIDAGRLIGVAGAPRPAMFVALRTGRRAAVLAVDAVLGVVTLASDALAVLPELLRDASTDVVSAIGMHDADLLMVLGTARIVPPSVWTAFDAREIQP